MAAMTPEPVAPGPSSVVQAQATPATASPARQSRDRSFEKLTRSYFGPVANKAVIDTAQFDRFRVISPKTRHPALNRGIEIENHAAGAGIPYHAPQPEKRRHA